MSKIIHLSSHLITIYHKSPYPTSPYFPASCKTSVSSHKCVYNSEIYREKVINWVFPLTLPHARSVLGNANDGRKGSRESDSVVSDFLCILKRTGEAEVHQGLERKSTPTKPAQ